MPDYADQYMRNPQSSLVIVRCDPWTHGGRIALIGDAAHAIVPFYGEGMNAGYEDCKVLNDLLDKHGDDNWPEVLHRYGTSRKPNGDASADLSLRNFVEMRDLVADPRKLPEMRRVLTDTLSMFDAFCAEVTSNNGDVDVHRASARISAA